MEYVYTVITTVTLKSTFPSALGHIVDFCPPSLTTGSHDSMSFCLDVSSPVLKSEPRLLRVIDMLFPCLTRPCIYRWATTQVEMYCMWHVQSLRPALQDLKGDNLMVRSGGFPQLVKSNISRFFSPCMCSKSLAANWKASLQRLLK